MTFLETYYKTIANKYNTDVDEAKKMVENYIIKLKRDIDNSNDDKVKTLWFEEFQGKSHPSADKFLSSIFLFNENPFIPNQTDSHLF